MGQDLVEARIQLRCVDIGIGPPGVPARLRATREAGEWRLYASSPSGTVAPLVGWLEAQAPVDIEVDSARLVTASFREPPRPLAFLSEPPVAEATLDPSGVLSVFARGARQEVHALLVQLEAAGLAPHVRHLAPPLHHEPLLTGAQDAAVRAAASAGFYQVPRKLTLHELAASMGVSTSSLSERLRRAEARLVMRYVREDGHRAHVEAARDPE